MAHFLCTEEEAITRLQAFWNPQNKQDVLAPPEAPPPQVPDLQSDEDLPPAPQKKTTIADFEEEDVEQAQVYSIYYSSTLILPVMGEGRKAVEAVAWC